AGGKEAHRELLRSWSMDQYEFIRIEQSPEQILKHVQRVGTGAQVVPRALRLPLGGITAEGSQVDLVDQGGRRTARLLLRLLDTVLKERPRLAREGILHQLSVHHHQGLWDRPLEAGRLIPLVVAEGEEELTEPGIPLLVALDAVSSAMGIRRHK